MVGMGLKSLDALLMYTDDRRHANAPRQQMARQVLAAAPALEVQPSAGTA